MTPSNKPSPLIRGLLLSTVILLFLSTVLGGILRTVDGVGACPDWPQCFGSWIPPMDHTTALVDYAHRLASAGAGLLGFFAFLLSLRKGKPDRQGTLFLGLANIVMALQIPLGRWLHLSEAWGLGTALHLGLALIAQALFLIVLIKVIEKPAQRQHWNFSSSYGQLALVTVALTLLTLVTGAMMTASGAASVCNRWPLCQGWDLTLSPAQWLSMTHRVIVLLTGIAFSGVLIQTWRTRREDPALLSAATAGAVLFLSQGLMGAVEVARSYPSPLLALHQATAIAVWSATVIHTALWAQTPHSDHDTPRAKQERRNFQQTAKDLLALTKPIVVSLLLVTTFAGMVIGAKAWPRLDTTLWVLLGGFMAAGGSGAINQYIDRQDDQRMQRTQDRPIPAGRLTPGEGLAFGVGMSIISFYIMVAFVNMIAALLTMAGIVYYVLIYSIYLKKTTVQNIVIGGGAGAIPPLVGWAAATGGLNIPSLFLFAVVFMWTPPHFWALAIVRRKDYARADIPMLPVEQGVQKTRRQIFIYTVELVVLTLLLPLFGLGGSVYFIFAVALGGWLLSAAWKVLKKEGNRFAWRMYRYSSMYLAFLFAALVIDALL